MEIENTFTYPEQLEQYQGIRSRAEELSVYIQKHTPDSRERLMALMKLRQAVAWANVAISEAT